MSLGLRSALFLTLSRIALAPIFILTYVYHDYIGIQTHTLPYALLFLLILSELSDVLDGVIARRTGQVTDLGKLLDPMADSIFRMSVFFSFTQGFLGLPLILVVLFFYRDCIISTLRILCALRGVTLAARLSGKIKAVIQAVVAIFIVLLMIPYNMGILSFETLYAYSVYSVLLAALYSIFSGIEYIVANRSYIKKALHL